MSLFTIDSLIFGSFIDVVEVSQNLDRGDVRSSIIYHSFRTMLD